MSIFAISGRISRPFALERGSPRVPGQPSPPPVVRQETNLSRISCYSNDCERDRRPIYMPASFATRYSAFWHLVLVSVTYEGY